MTQGQSAWALGTLSLTLPSWSWLFHAIRLGEGRRTCGIVPSFRMAELLRLSRSITVTEETDRGEP